MNHLRALSQVLETSDPGREVWRLPGTPPVCARDVVRMLGGAEAVASQCAGRCVAIAVHSDRSLAPLLVLLDGVAREITLLPGGLREEQVAAILVRSEAELLVTSDRDAVAPAGVEVLCVDQDWLWGQMVHGEGYEPEWMGPNEESPQARKAGGDLMLDPSHPTRESRADEALGGVVEVSRVRVPEANIATRWVLPTSGTTGQPKLVAHTLSSLTRTTKLDVNRGRDHRWGSLYNLTGFAGLQVFLQSWCGGSCLILARAGTLLEERVDDLIASGCTALSATPTMWRKLLMATRVRRLPLKQITLGGEIVDQKILDALATVFPAAKIVHIYASTEAGVGFAVRDGRAGFPAAFLHDPPRGVRLLVDPHGVLCLRSDRDDQEYLSEATPLKRDDGFVDTGDLVTRRGDRYCFLGRANGTINVGGNKVHPEEVEDCLLGCEGVLLARVTSRPSSFTGQLVQAEIVVDPACPETWEEVRRRVIAHCRAHLAPFKVPAILQRVETLESTPTGKLSRSN